MPVVSRPVLLGCLLAGGVGLVGGGVYTRGARPPAPTMAPREVLREASHPTWSAPPLSAMGGGSTVYSLAMHMHGSISEGNAGMGWHTEQALTNNIDVLWWTDHDVFYYPEASPSVDGCDFESGTEADTIASWPSTEQVDVAWRSLREAAPLRMASLRVVNAGAHGGLFGARFAALAHDVEDEERATWFLHVSPRLQFKSLMSDLSLDFWVRPVTTSDAGELRVVVPLNGTRSGESHPPDDDHKSIVFYHGGAGHPAASDDGQTLWVPITAADRAWNEVHVNLTDLAVAAWGDEARDLHAEMITVSLVGSSAADFRYDLDDLAWSMATTGQDLVDAQSDFLTGLGTPPRHLLGIEVSPLPEGHLNVYGSDVPLLPYSTSDTWDAASMGDWAHGYGGIVSYNHMFGVRTDRDDAGTRATKVSDAIHEIVANRMWGLDLLEVGYRVRGGLIDDFLEVWDAVGMAGVYVTGIGAFDLHDQVAYAGFANDFVTYVPLDRFSEAGLIDALKRGNAWFGDPLYFTDGHVRLGVNTNSPPAEAGDVVIGMTSEVEVTFRGDDLPAFSTVRLVENGVVTRTWGIAAGGEQSVSATVDPVGGNVVRFELVTARGAPMAYTNPIYFVDRYAADIPEDRRIFAPDWLRAHHGAAVR